MTFFVQKRIVYQILPFSWFHKYFFTANPIVLNFGVLLCPNDGILQIISSLIEPHVLIQGPGLCYFQTFKHD